MSLLEKLKGGSNGTSAVAPPPAQGRDPALDRVKYEDKAANDPEPEAEPETPVPASPGLLDRLRAQTPAVEPEASTKTPRTRKTKTEEAPASALSLDKVVHVAFHFVAIYAGQSPELAKAHFEAWKAIGS